MDLLNSLLSGFGIIIALLIALIPLIIGVAATAAHTRSSGSIPVPCKQAVRVLIRIAHRFCDPADRGLMRSCRHCRTGRSTCPA